MKPALANLLALILIVAIISIAASPSAADDDPAPAAFGFGMDAGSLALQEDAGVKADYGTFWVGPWTLTSGWGGPKSQLDTMRSQGVTPAIHYYYWGDDISPSCVENGCWSDLHNTWKDQAGWEQLAEELVDALNERMQGDRVVIFMETEFNKAGMVDHEPFDALLAEKARFIKAGYPAAEIVIAFGNWNPGAWPNFSESMSASDYAGIQGMRGSTRHSESQYLTLYEATLDGARTMQQIFGKPVFITDIALSSYPEPEYLEHQSTALAKFFTGMDELRSAGVEAMLYRGWHDHPSKDLANYFGIAERHWGLAYPSDKSLKSSGEVWIDGVKAVRTADLRQPSGGTEPFAATFRVSPNVNEWWLEVTVDASSVPKSVAARIDGADWLDLPRTDWGSWARSTHAPAGSEVVFRATDTHGQSVVSDTYTWLQGDEEPEGEPEPKPQPMLKAITSKLRGLHKVDLSWSGLSGDSVTVLRDGRSVATLANSGEHRDEPDGRGPGSYTYQLCESDGATCTEHVTVRF